MDNMVAAAVAFLRDSFDGSEFLNANPQKKEYRFEHSLRVAAIGAKIARAEGLDEVALSLGCVLHDIAYKDGFSDVIDAENHGRSSARIARPFLLSLGLDEKLVEEICFGIAIHVDDMADFDGERTVLAQSIGDSDNIDRFGALRTLESFLYSGFLDKSMSDKLDHLKSRAAHLREYEKLEFATPTATAMWREKLAYNLDFIDRLEKQLTSNEQL